jgi:hypothetical protein
MEDRRELERPIFVVYDGKIFGNDEYCGFGADDDVFTTDDNNLKEFLSSDYLINVRENHKLREKYLKSGSVEMNNRILFVMHKSNINKIYKIDPWIIFIFHHDWHAVL